MTLTEKQEILAKSTLTRKDIEKLANVKSSRALQIMKICKERYKGEVPNRNTVIAAESYWKFEGTTLERQIKIYGKDLHKGKV